MPLDNVPGGSVRKKGVRRPRRERTRRERQRRPRKKRLRLKRIRVPRQRKQEPDLEQEVLRQFTAEQQRITGELAKVQNYFRDEYDSQFWACFVFQTQDQLVAFLDGIGWNREQDGERWISGTRLAAFLNERSKAMATLVEHAGLRHHQREKHPGEWAACSACAPDRAAIEEISKRVFELPLGPRWKTAKPAAQRWVALARDESEYSKE